MRSGIGNSPSDPFYVAQTTSTGAAAPSATVSDPQFHRSVGGANIATLQATSSISPANATLIVGGRAGRQSVILTNVTGTQPVYFVNAPNATGTTTGFFLAGTVGASVTVATTAALYATSPTASQTIAVLENY